MAGENMRFKEQYVAQLGEWDFSVPLKFLWFVEIETIPGYINSESMRRHEPSNTTQSAPGNTSSMEVWDIDEPKQKINKDKYMRTKAGCILAQGVVLPGEQVSTQTVSVKNNMGFLPGLISGNRDAPTELTVQFRETNTSLPDLLIRPWIELTSHMGMVARDSSNNVKTTMRVIQFAKAGPNQDLIRRKTWSFYNCVPVGMDGAELTYDANEIKLYSVRWKYTHYGIAYKSGEIIQPKNKSTRESQYFTVDDYDTVTDATRAEDARIKQKLARLKTMREEFQGRIVSEKSIIDFYDGDVAREPAGKDVTSRDFAKPVARESDGVDTTSRDFATPVARESGGTGTSSRDFANPVFRQSTPRDVTSRDFAEPVARVDRGTISTANWNSRMSRKNENIGGALGRLQSARRKLKSSLDFKSRIKRRLGSLFD